jgi:hypothetical protein
MVVTRTVVTHYVMVSRWNVRGTVEEVAEVMRDFEALPRWWPSVYLFTREVASGGADGVGKKVAMHTRGRLPYTLRWDCVLTEPITRRGFAIAASGDLNGVGRWTFEPTVEGVSLTFDWNVTTAKPLLQRLGWLLKPAFVANHRWAMAHGGESLQRELDRRRRKAGT